MVGVTFVGVVFGEVDPACTMAGHAQLWAGAGRDDFGQRNAGMTFPSEVPMSM